MEYQMLSLFIMSRLPVQERDPTSNVDMYVYS